MKIAHIADCHLRQSQYGSRERGRDFFRGLMSAVTKAVEVEKVDAILCAGDMLDNPYPSAEIINNQLGTIHKYLVEHGVPMLVINGNHDNTKVPWSQVFCDEMDNTSGMIPVDHKEYLLTKDGYKPVRVRGIPYCSPEDFRMYMSELEEKDAKFDIIMWHGSISEFCSFHIENGVSINDFPAGCCQVAAVGDLHIHAKMEREEDGMIVAYPGSTEMCSTSELSTKFMYVYTFDKQGKLDRIEDVAFNTRRVQRFSIHTLEELEKAYSEMRPEALVFVDYSVDVPGVLPRLSGFVDEHPGTILRPTPIKSVKVHVEGEMFESACAPLQPLHEFSWTFMKEKNSSGKVAELVKQLTNPAIDSREVIEEYVNTSLTTP